MSEQQRLLIEDTKNLSDEMILNYISTGEPMDKAAAYAIQGLGAQFIDRIDGDYDNVVGLPMKSLLYKLEQMNAIKSRKEELGF